MNTILSAADSHSAAFFSLLKNPLKFRIFLLQKLPAAYFSGLHVNEMNEQLCAVSVPFKWFTQNPFRSTYFACLSMAAEMSTGILAMAHIYKKNPKISMLVVSVEGVFFKKAVSNTKFICREGLVIKEAIQKSITLAQPQTAKVKSEGFNKQNELIAEFWITWSFKAKG